MTSAQQAEDEAMIKAAEEAERTYRESLPSTSHSKAVSNESSMQAGPVTTLPSCPERPLPLTSSRQLSVSVPSTSMEQSSSSAASFQSPAKQSNTPEKILPKTWQEAMPIEQQTWLCKVLFQPNSKTGKQELTR